MKKVLMVTQVLVQKVSLVMLVVLVHKVKKEMLVKMEV